MKKTLIFSVLLLICLPLLACSPDVPPEAVTTDEMVVDHVNDDHPDATQPPVGDPDHVHEASTPVTEIDQIVGTWIAAADLGNFVATVFPDGVFSVATSLEDLERGSTDSWQMVIQDGQITASDFALCIGEVGSYLAVINEDGTLKITTILDPCVTRIRKMDRSLPGRLNPYNLIYHKVE